MPHHHIRVFNVKTPSPLQYRFRPFSPLLLGVSNACKPKRHCSYAHARCSVTLGKGSWDIVVITVAITTAATAAAVVATAITVAIRIIIDLHGICLGAP